MARRPIHDRARVRIVRSDDYPALPAWRRIDRASCLLRSCSVVASILILLLALWFTALLVGGAFNR